MNHCGDTGGTSPPEGTIHRLLRTDTQNKAAQRFSAVLAKSLKVESTLDASIERLYAADWDSTPCAQPSGAVEGEQPEKEKGVRFAGLSARQGDQRLASRSSQGIEFRCHAANSTSVSPAPRRPLKTSSHSWIRSPKLEDLATRRASAGAAWDETTRLLEACIAPPRQYTGSRDGEGKSSPTSSRSPSPWSQCGPGGKCASARHEQRCSHSGDSKRSGRTPCVKAPWLPPGIAPVGMHSGCASRPGSVPASPCGSRPMSHCPSSTSNQGMVAGSKMEAAAASVRPSASATEVVYFGQMNVRIAEVAKRCKAMNAASRERISVAIEDGSFLQVALKVFHSMDKAATGSLSWAAGDVMEFINQVFFQFSMEAPCQDLVHQLYLLFDLHQTGKLDSRSSVALADALVRAFVLAENGGMETEVAIAALASATDCGSLPTPLGVHVFTPHGVTQESRASPLRSAYIPPPPSPLAGQSDAGNQRPAYCEAEKWSPQEVAVWAVNSLGLPAGLGEKLEQEEVHGPVLLSLVEDDLIRLGIEPFGRRRQLLLGIEVLKKGYTQGLLAKDVLDFAHQRSSASVTPTGDAIDRKGGRSPRHRMIATPVVVAPVVALGAAVCSAPVIHPPLERRLSRAPSPAPQAASLSTSATGLSVSKLVAVPAGLLVGASPRTVTEESTTSRSLPLGGSAGGSTPCTMSGYGSPLVWAPCLTPVRPGIARAVNTARVVSQGVQDAPDADGASMYVNVRRAKSASA